MKRDPRREMLRAKVHRVAVTECDLAYEGSLTLDAEMMRAADMLEFEKIEVYDVDNGNRFSTYLIEGEAGGGGCCVNGAAAHLVKKGHKLIIASYASIHEADVPRHKPKIVLIGAGNRIRQVTPRPGPEGRYAVGGPNVRSKSATRDV